MGRITLHTNPLLEARLTPYAARWGASQAATLMIDRYAEIIARERPILPHIFPPPERAHLVALMAGQRVDAVDVPVAILDAVRGSTAPEGVDKAQLVAHIEALGTAAGFALMDWIEAGAPA